MSPESSYCLSVIHSSMCMWKLKQKYDKKEISTPADPQHTITLARIFWITKKTQEMKGNTRTELFNTI